MQNMEARRGVEVKEQEWYFKNAISLTHHKGAHEKTQIKFDLERPAEEHSEESDDDEGMEIIDENEIELTLGPSSYNRSKKTDTQLTSDSGHSLSSSSTESNGGMIRNSYGIEEQLRQERLKQSPWFFQVMNLNMT
jgi:hypothetical protein